MREMSLRIRNGTISVRPKNNDEDTDGGNPNPRWAPLSNQARPVQ